MVLKHFFCLNIPEVHHTFTLITGLQMCVVGMHVIWGATHTLVCMYCMVLSIQGLEAMMSQ